MVITAMQKCCVETVLGDCNVMQNMNLYIAWAGVFNALNSSELSAKRNVFRKIKRPKTEMMWKGSCKRFGSEFHVIGPDQRCCRDAVSEIVTQCAL